MLSSRQASDEKLAALDAGADDYVTKPFSIDRCLSTDPGMGYRIER